MIRLTAPQTEVLMALVVLSREGTWFQTELILRERMEGKEFNHKSFFRATEGILLKLEGSVPRLVESRSGKTGKSWRLTPAGKAVAETQLGAR